MELRQCQSRLPATSIEQQRRRWLLRQPAAAAAYRSAARRGNASQDRGASPLCYESPTPSAPALQVQAGPGSIIYSLLCPWPHLLGPAQHGAVVPGVHQGFDMACRQAVYMCGVRAHVVHVWRVRACAPARVWACVHVWRQLERQLPRRLPWGCCQPLPRRAGEHNSTLPSSIAAHVLPSRVDNSFPTGHKRLCPPTHLVRLAAWGCGLGCYNSLLACCSSVPPARRPPLRPAAPAARTAADSTPSLIRASEGLAAFEEVPIPTIKKDMPLLLAHGTPAWIRGTQHSRRSSIPSVDLCPYMFHSSITFSCPLLPVKF